MVISTSVSNCYTHTHTHPLTALCPGLPGWAGTRKAKPIWILLKQDTVSGSGISWTVCKSAPRSRQISTPARHHSVLYRLYALPAAQPTVSKHWRQTANQQWINTSRCISLFCVAEFKAKGEVLYKFAAVPGTNINKLIRYINRW